MDEVLTALKRLYEAYSANMERHGMNGDDTWTDRDHEDWQGSAGYAVNALKRNRAFD